MLRRLKSLSFTQVSAATGTVASVATVIALFQPFGGDSDPPTGNQPSQQGLAGVAGVPKASGSAEDDLLLHVPIAARAECERERRKWRGAQAALSCPFRDTDRLVYVMFDTVRNMYDAFGREADVPLATGDATDKCPNRWNVQSEFKTDKHDDIGRLACYTASGRSWIAWTRDDLKIYASMARDDHKRRALFDDWLYAGPVPP